MSDRHERGCKECGSLLHHEDDCLGKVSELKCGKCGATLKDAPIREESGLCAPCYWKALPLNEAVESPESGWVIRGRLESLGSDEAGQPRLLIHTTKEQLRGLPLALAFAASIEVTVRPVRVEEEEAKG